MPHCLCLPHGTLKADQELKKCLSARLDVHEVFGTCMGDLAYVCGNNV